MQLHTAESYFLISWGSLTLHFSVMIKKHLFTGLLLSFCFTIAAQTVPQGINYQAVARDNTGQVLADHNLLLQVSLMERGERQGAYIEYHDVVTNNVGLFTLVVGEGMPMEKEFSAVDWSSGEVWIELSMDADGDGSFDLVHSSKLLSVPYALHAESAARLKGSDGEQRAGQEYWAIYGNKNLDPDIHFMGNGDSVDVVFRTDNTERMRISAIGDVTMEEDLDVTDTVEAGFFVGDGSGITNLPPDEDDDPNNEIQTISLVGTMLTLSDGGGTVDLGDTDVDPTNEIQTLTQTGNTVVLSDGGGTITVDDGDSDPTNEIQTLSLAGDMLTLSDGGGTIVLPSGGGGGSPTDELQDLSLAGDMLSLSNDPTPTPIDLSPYLDNTDAQMLGLSGFELSITGGNTITLPSGGGGGGSVWSLNGPDAYYSGGNVGIGTSTPKGSLEIDANSSLSDPHMWLHENGNDYARLNFDNNNGSNYWTLAAYVASNVKNDRFNIWNGATGDILSITGDGEMGLNVGISPKVTFHVGNGHRVLFGTDTLGNGDKLMFLPDLHAFRVGTVATGAASTYWNRDSIGLYSFASGLNTRAQGFGATATGRDTEATNSYAFASGFFTNADGQYSTAMGFNTDAFALGSTALGYSTDAEQNYSFAAGYFAEAQAIYSVAIGNAVRAQSFASMAVGRYNVGGGSPTSWLSGDPIFEIGIGTGPSSRANAVTVRKNGNVGIGTTVPLDRLHVNGRIRLQTVEYFEDGGTSEIAVRGDLRPSADNTYDIGTSSLRYDDVYATSGTVNTSDARDKTNIQTLQYGLEEILRLYPVTYNWRSSHMGETKIGLIAQDVRQVLPEVVKTHDWEEGEAPGEGHVFELDRLGIYYSDIIPVLINGMQEQYQIVKEQENTIEELNARIEQLEEAVEKLLAGEKVVSGG